MPKAVSQFLNRLHVWSKFFLLEIAVLSLASCATISSTQSSKPNVLFIVVDDLNNDLGVYGHKLVSSPHVDALAARGVLFERAYVQAPMCTPSRESMMTGLYPEQNGVIGHGDHFRNYANFRDHVPSVIAMPQLFRENGYNTVRVGKIYHQGVPGGIGAPGPDDPLSWDKVFDPSGTDRQVDGQIQSIHKSKDNRNFGGTLSWLNLPSKGEDHTDGLVASQAIRLLSEYHPNKTGKPFFIGVGFYRPHTPYIAPPEYFDLYPLDLIEPVTGPSDDRTDIPVAALSDKAEQRELPLEKKKEIIQAYYASISFMDAQLGRVMDELDRLGLADNTIVVFVSDHGYHLGNHGGLWQKSTLFEDATHVPLIISAPGKLIDVRATGPVELVDLYPTLTELAQLDRPDYISGRSLAPILEDNQTIVREGALSMLRSRAGRMHPVYKNTDIMGYSIRTERFRYTEWADGNLGVEMYDHQVDPGELNNLADHTPLENERMRLKRLLRVRRAQAAKRIPEIEIGGYALFGPDAEPHVTDRSYGDD